MELVEMGIYINSIDKLSSRVPILPCLPSLALPIANLPMLTSSPPRDLMASLLMNPYILYPSCSILEFTKIMSSGFLFSNLIIPLHYPMKDSSYPFPGLLYCFSLSYCFDSSHYQKRLFSIYIILIF